MITMTTTMKDMMMSINPKLTTMMIITMNLLGGADQPTISKFNKFNF